MDKYTAEIIIVSACALQFMMDRKGQMNILQRFQYTAETIVFTIEIVKNMPQGLVIHLCMSVEAAPLDLVLYMCQQVEADLGMIKNHPDYTKVLPLDVSEGELSS